MDKQYPNRIAVNVERVWFGSLDSASTLMLMTTSPFVAGKDFEAEVLIGELRFLVTFSFSGIAAFSDRISRGLYRATKLRDASAEIPNLNTPKLCLSGPPFEVKS